MDQKLAKWKRWLRVVHDDVQKLVMHKDIFWQIGEIVNSNPKIQIHSAFYDFIGNSHAAYVVMGIRRHVKTHKDSISFRALLEDIAANAEILSREYYRALYAGSGMEDLADGDFDQFSKPGGEHIDPDLVSTDIKRLEEAGKKAEELADRRIAHYDKKEVSVLPTYNEVDACIDLSVISGPKADRRNDLDSCACDSGRWNTAFRENN